MWVHGPPSVPRRTYSPQCRGLIPWCIRLDGHLKRSCPDPIKRTRNPMTTPVENMGVDHGRLYVLVTEELLDSPDVMPSLKQVGGEGVAEGVRRDRLGEVCPPCGHPDGLLDALRVEVVPSDHAAAGIRGQLLRWEDILPVPAPSRPG